MSFDEACGLCDHWHNNWTKNSVHFAEESFPCFAIFLVGCFPCQVMCCLYGCTRENCCCAKTTWSPYNNVGINYSGTHGQRTYRTEYYEVGNYDECPCRWSGCEQIKPQGPRLMGMS